MLYKFKSKAAGDLVMLGPDGDRLLALLGRAPAAKGIIEPPAMAEAVALLRAAADADDAARAANPDQAAPGVALRQRVWPMVDMLTRAQAAGQPVVWGV